MILIPYEHSRSVPIADQTILAHTKVYVLADRFNITALKTLSFSKLSALFKAMGVSVALLTETHAIAITNTVSYAFDNLPFRGGDTTGSTSTGSNQGPAVPTTSTTDLEPLLKFLAHYISWSLEIFKNMDGFLKLLSDHPDLLKVVLFSCKPASSPPWVTPTSTIIPPTTATSTSIPTITPTTTTYTQIASTQSTYLDEYDDSD